MTLGDGGTLLCVSNWPANTGFAWDFIERLYARIADHVATHGVRTLVAYPSISEAPRTLAGSAARPVVLDTALDTLASIRDTEEFIRREKVGVVYFTDRSARSRVYRRLRRAGARRILVHDHCSGERTRPRGPRRVVKWLLSRLPGFTADVVIAVSDYVARRHVEVGLIPAKRVVRVWNGLPLPVLSQSAPLRARDLCGVGAGRLVVGCACRAAPEKGVDHLLRAFDQVVRGWRQNDCPPVLAYLGDGPQLAGLRKLRDGLRAKNEILLVGYRPDAAAILAGADLCVVPSVWQEAFPLAVLETMAAGRAVIASSVGGIPEMIEDGVTGVLVPPADEAALATAIAALLSDPARLRALGEAARRRVAERFAADEQIRRLAALVEEGFGSPCDGVSVRGRVASAMHGGPFRTAVSVSRPRGS